MPKHYIQKIELQGFRGFGTSPQSITLPNTVAALWGGNSQGKTSLAEAVEFLLTGHIARRELLASAKDEFSHSLRNAHIPAATPVFVEAHFMCADGNVRRLRRTLTTDYNGGAPCTSTLELEGAVCGEADIEGTIGVRLLHPPLRAPVLAQHTLGYVFTASPTDRAAYFRAVLDTQDLEDFRSAVANLIPDLPAPNAPELSHLEEVEKVEGLESNVNVVRNAKSKSAVEKALASALETLLTTIGIPAKPSLGDRVEQLASELESRRKLTFPLELFRRKPLAAWAAPTEQLTAPVDAFLRERAAISEETRRLVSLFESALAIPAVHDCEEATDCPLCGTAAGLSSDRVAHIKSQLAANHSYQSAEKALIERLRGIDARLQTLMETTTQALPKFMQVSGAERRKRSFRVQRVETLSGDAAATIGWVTASRALWRSARAFSRESSRMRSYIASALQGLNSWENDAGLLQGLGALAQSYAALEAVSSNYASAVQAIGDNIKAAVDQSAQTGGWEELLELARGPAALFKALESLRHHKAKIKTIEQAVSEIDTANGKVADEKFAGLSSQVSDWWERLRPGEATFFSAVQRRGAKTRRTVDLKVALSAKEDRSDPKLRDAVAVFSQSQLHCLGLSLFLARAVDGGAGFVLLDDPVLTSDDDFRPNFASTVIEALLDAGLQVIVVTQDYKSWKDIGHRWDHRGAAQFQIVRDNAVAGTEIRSQDDALVTMLAQAQPFINSQDGDQRKSGATRLRQVIERFGKELLVKSRRANGDSLASITEYDGKNFGDFSAQVLALLTLDPAHKGKLMAAHNYVTPGPHDDTPPSTAQLKVAAGDIKRLKKDYLG